LRDSSIVVYDVVLDYNNGTGDRAEYEVEQGGKISKSNANKATRKGYTLVGYSENSEAQPSDAGVIKINKFPYTPTASVTLYAVWEKVITSSVPAKITSCSPTIVPPRTAESPNSFLSLF